MSFSIFLWFSYGFPMIVPLSYGFPMFFMRFLAGPDIASVDDVKDEIFDMVKSKTWLVVVAGICWEKHGEDATFSDGGFVGRSCTQVYDYKYVYISKYIFIYSHL